MKAIEIRNKFLEFFKKHNHTIIPSAPLIPENDPSVLFTTAGMQPLVPYLLGEKHPGGKRIADYQKCVRTVDIDSVGDNRHLTYFEMLGNWSLGDYFKKEAIAMSYKFLTEELGIDPEKLSVTCFAGDADAPKDIEAFEAWKNAGIPEERIYFYGKEDNWWIAGEEGPCGPDTEMFLDTGKPACSENCQPSCNCGKYVEIWNNVFMEYYKSKDGIKKLEQKNVDTGLGLERMAMLLQKVETPFDTELFKPVMEELEKLEKIDDIKSRRIVAEHLRSSIMIIADGGRPSNIDRGYVLRRLIRRMTRHMSKLQIDLENISDLIDLTINNLNEMYPELQTKRDIIKNVIIEEKDKFIKTLGHGEKEFEKVINKLEQENKNVIDGKTIFKLYETYGFPPEITADLAQEKGYKIDLTEFDKLFKEHQEKSRLGSEQKFKGGLAEQNEITTAYHTATHLLHQALRNVLGDHVKQSGSNITTERLRFDFSHPEKMTPEQIKQVEDIVNEQIKRDLNVVSEEMPLEEAKKSGAIGLFENKYGDTVKVYTIGDFSKEICGGPHVKHTGELGHFKIKKEESSSAGIRRIKAILE
ncbi:MAG: alanine--tRNA ligase [Clostridia bacterium]|jgi:alanyl-tRNA synthetase|nr:alanine--tRNA ligase [Clostridia bacterium]MEE0790916.1 alanine--tRNA ligase [Clostridia bacterium]HJJ09383.1 alanine--tRNA ligase [Clostridiaceae bacterium]